MDDLNRNTDFDTTARRAPDAEATRATADSARVPDDVRQLDNATGDEIGEAVGGISGVLTGAALGSLGGPIGTVIGGIAGAVSGWWAGRAISEAANHVTTEDERYYRTHYESAERRVADRSYDDVRPAYQVGHLAGRNPDYADRKFEEVEGDLQRGWSSTVSQAHGSWDQVRDYAQHAYDRGRSSGFGAGALAGSANASAGTSGSTGGATRSITPSDNLASSGTSSTGTLGSEMSAAGDRLTDRAENAWDRTKDAARDLGHRAANAADDLKDRVDGNPASRPGPDATDRAGSAWNRTENAAEDTWDRTADAARNAGHSAANAIDDMKDRVDGNPASKPGLDATDRPERAS